jgi:Na+-transporting NADH:ubiquinone oxidoreductase subunit D
LAVAFFRELFGTGTLFGYQVIPEAWYASNGGYYVDNGFMLLPPMALIVVGVIIWVQRARNTKLIEEA